MLSTPRITIEGESSGSGFHHPAHVARLAEDLRADQAPEAMIEALDFVRRVRGQEAINKLADQNRYLIGHTICANEIDAALFVEGTKEGAKAGHFSELNIGIWDEYVVDHRMAFNVRRALFDTAFRGRFPIVPVMPNAEISWLNPPAGVPERHALNMVDNYLHIAALAVPDDMKRQFAEQAYEYLA